MKISRKPGFNSLLFIIAGVFLFVTWNAALNAANYITVATIGGGPPAMDKSLGMQQAVEKVKAFWQNQLAQVLPDKPDLIVLPEHCDLPGGWSSLRNEYLQTRKNQIRDFFASIAREYHCYIAYGTHRQLEDGSLRNSLMVIDRNGDVAGIYNKNFPTIGEMESGIKAGNKAQLIRCDFGTIGCAICFDLNFKELRETYEAEKPDIIAFSSMYHGGSVQEDWAYSCHSFFIGAIGSTKTPSQVRNPLGKIVAGSTNYFNYAVTRINLDSRVAHLDENRQRFSDMKAKYGKKVTILDPGELGPVLLSSEDPDISVDQMIREFHIELFDDYFARSRAVRLKPENRE